MKNKPITVFLDGVDFQHEIGYACGGNTVYPNAEDLKKYSSCWEECGIVECEINFKKWIVKQDFRNMTKNSILAEEFDDINRQISHTEKRLEYLEQLVDGQKHKLIDLKASLKDKNRGNK